MSDNHFNLREMFSFKLFNLEQRPHIIHTTCNKISVFMIMSFIALIPNIVGIERKINCHKDGSFLILTSINDDRGNT